MLYFEILLPMSPHCCILYLDPDNSLDCLELAICSRSFRCIKKRTGKNAMQGKYALKELQIIDGKMPPYFRKYWKLWNLAFFKVISDKNLCLLSLTTAMQRL